MPFSGAICRIWTLSCLLMSIFAITTHSSGQQSQSQTDRLNLGFKGPVRSVLTVVERPHSDRHPERHHQQAPGKAAFDIQGKRTAFALFDPMNQTKVIAECTLQQDGTEHCGDNNGQQQNTRQENRTLSDGRRETLFYRNDRVEFRSVLRLDDHGALISVRNYNSEGRLVSEQSVMRDSEGATTTEKSYEGDPHTAVTLQTRISDDQKRFDRWWYNAQGHLLRHLALDGEGEVLSSWFDTGQEQKVSRFETWGICRPHRCVSYTFDENGTGRLAKTVEHIPGPGNREPENGEHYNSDGFLNEKIEIKYQRDASGNWISRSVLIWTPESNQVIEVERDTRTIQYY